MLHQFPCIIGKAPVIGSVAALLFGLVKREFGIFLVNCTDGVLSGPLESCAGYVYTRRGIVEDRLDHFWVRSLHGSEHHLDTDRSHARTEVVSEEFMETLHGPRAARVRLARVEFVLRHHHEDVDTLFPICLYELLKVERVGFHILRVLVEHVGSFGSRLLGFDIGMELLGEERRRNAACVVTVVLHPNRRTPWRRPDPDVGVVVLRVMNERDERLSIVFDREMLHFEVAGCLVVRIPVPCEVVRSYGHAAHGEIGADARLEQFAEDRFAVFGTQQA